MFIPGFTRHLEAGSSAFARLQIFKDDGTSAYGPKVKSFSVPARKFGQGNLLGFSIKVADFHKPAPADANKIFEYSAELSASSGASSDLLKFTFLVAPEFQRHIVVVLDSSGSNTQTDPSNLRIVAGKRTLDLLTSKAKAQGKRVLPDTAAAVDFDDSARTISPFVDPPDVKPALDSVDSSGGTDIAAGINLAVSLLEGANVIGPEQNKKNKSAICLFTDGQNGNGPGPVVAAINSAGAKGIRVHYGFLNPVQSQPFARAAVVAAATPQTIQEAVLASGGVYGEITDDISQLAFVDQIANQGLTSGDGSNPQILGSLKLTFQLPADSSERFHEFVGKKGESVTVRVQSDDFNPEIVVIDSPPVALIPVSNSMASGIAEVTVVLPRDGTFQIGVRGDNTGAGVYTLFTNVANDLGLDKPVIRQPMSKPALNRQTGLFEQRVTVTASANSSISAFRLVISGISRNVVLRNRTGVTADGAQYIDVPADSANHSKVILLQYFVPDRKVPQPVLTIQ